MSNVISLAARINERRATAIVKGRIAERQAADQKKLDELAAAGRAAFAGDPDGEVVVSVLTSIVAASQRAKAARDADRPMPAYCDPSNEVQGTKYAATKGLRCVEIAARIRADIKGAIKAGTLPTGLKVSVRYQSYAGGQSIDARIVALPAELQIYNPDYVAFCREHPHEVPPFAPRQRHSEEYRLILERLEAIHGAYNRDNSDSMTDYFDVRYHGHVQLDWRLEKQARESQQPRD